MLGYTIISTSAKHNWSTGCNQKMFENRKQRGLWRSASWSVVSYPNLWLGSCFDNHYSVPLCPLCISMDHLLFITHNTVGYSQAHTKQPSLAGTGLSSSEQTGLSWLEHTGLSWLEHTWSSWLEHTVLSWLEHTWFSWLEHTGLSWLEHTGLSG